MCAFLSSSGSPHDSAELLAEMSEAFPDGIVIVDREWRITYANTAARTIGGIEPHHLNGPSYWELYPAMVGSEQEDGFRRSMDQRVVTEHQFFYAPFQIWISMRTVPVSAGLALVYRDVTLWKQAERTRDEMARGLQQVFETTSDGVLFLDKNYNYTFVNARAREILDAGGELVGQNLWEKYPDAMYEGSPYVLNYRKAMEEGQSSRFEAWYPHPLEKWLSIAVHPSPDGIIVFFRDITQDRKAAAELQEQREQAERRAGEIEAIYRTAPIGLAFFDPVEFRYLKLNDRQADFFGLKPEQVVGRSLTEMAPIAGLRELFEQVLTGHSVINYPLEGALVSNPAEYRYWTVNYVPVYAADGTISGISAASLETTQQRRAEKALIQSEKLAAVGRLASSISHEINNPLESVTNLLYLLSTRNDLSPDAAGFVKIAQQELERVAQITTQTLRFYRQNEKPYLTTAEEIINPVLRLFRGRLANSGIAIHTRFADSGPILCLASEIRQVLNNLIGNALDAMHGGGRLDIRSRDGIDAATGRPGLRITISDTGHGMSAETRGHIFDPFFTTKDIHGTGLGLWISSEIVARHHGRIRVYSSSSPAHHGAVFTLFLPRDEAV